MFNAEIIEPNMQKRLKSAKKINKNESFIQNNIDCWSMEIPSNYAKLL